MISDGETEAQRGPGLLGELDGRVGLEFSAGHSRISDLSTLPCHPRCQCLKPWPGDSAPGSPSYPTPPTSPAVPADPPPGPPLQPPRTPDAMAGEPAHAGLLDAASSSSASSCPPCSPEPGTEAPGPEPAAAAVGSGVSGEGRSEKGRLYCPTCKVTVNSASQLQAHNTGECAHG